jgi:hypothetical protein
MNCLLTQAKTRPLKTNSLNKVGSPGGNIWTNNKYEDGTVIGRPEE